jgi:hypothetical protein
MAMLYSSCKNALIYDSIQSINYMAPRIKGKKTMKEKDDTHQDSTLPACHGPCDRGIHIHRQGITMDDGLEELVGRMGR